MSKTILKMHSGCCSFFEVGCKIKFDHNVVEGARWEFGKKINIKCHILYIQAVAIGRTILLFTGCFGEPMPVRYGYSASLPNDMLTNGTFQSKRFVYAGDKINYTCAAGTIPVGGNQVPCLTNGKWEKPTFSCQGIFLHMPWVTN